MSEARKLRIVVFGKAGCDKCKVLNRRIDALLEKDEWKARFEKAYMDVETEDGIVAFCRSECVNPQRIPAFVIQQFNEQTGRYEPVADPAPGTRRDATGSSQLYQFLGLQTDYSEAGKGVLTPKMISSVMHEALGEP